MRKRINFISGVLIIFCMLLAGCAEDEPASSAEDILGAYEGTSTVVKVIEGEEVEGERHSLGNEVGDVEPYYLCVIKSYSETSYKIGFDEAGEDWTMADYDPKTGILTYGSGEMMNAELSLTEKDDVPAFTGKMISMLGVWGGAEHEIEVVKVSDEVPQE